MEEELNKLLNGEEMKRIADCEILSYPELYNYKSIPQLFENNKNGVIMILYLQNKTANSMVGHWCLLSKRGNICEFFDPYSLMPDSQLKWNDTEKNEALGQDSNYLTKLLYDFSKKGGIIEFNNMRFQKKNKFINTCGRHVALRAKFYEIPLKKYQNLFKKLRKKGYNLDELSVLLTNQLLNNY